MSLELILGPMFAGKSSHLLGILRRNRIIGRKTLVITNSLDTRYATAATAIMSHDKESFPAIAVSTLMTVFDMPEFREAEAIVIEEAQFFPDLLDFVLPAVDIHGRHILCVGLDGDSERRPFGQLLDLIPYCNSVTKHTALCTECCDGTPAIFTYREPGEPSAQINVGTSQNYKPLCRKHYLFAELEKRFESPEELAAYVGALGLLRTCKTDEETIAACFRLLGAERGTFLYQCIH